MRSFDLQAGGQGEIMAKQSLNTPCTRCPLQDCPGLRQHTEDELEYLESFKQGELAVDRNSVVVEQGKSGSHLYSVLEGVLIRYRSLEDGRRQIVNFMFPGDLVGLQGAFDDPATHSVEALLDAKLCVFSRSDFVMLMQKRPRLGYDLTWLAAKEETALEEHIVSLGQRSAKERVAYLAVWLIDRALDTCMAGKGNTLDLPITQAQIADMLGLSQVHTNRTLRALDKEGLIVWKPGEVSVPKMEAACEFAQYERSEKRSRPFI